MEPSSRDLRDKSNESGINAFCPQKRKPRHAGPMSMQPVDRSATMPMPLLPHAPRSI
jgi:hypothetical protein